MTAPLLDVRGLSCWFELGGMLEKSRLRAVHDLSFSIDRGQILALVGESGSGKSTIARLLCRLVPASAGQILLDGEDVLSTQARAPDRQYRKRVQMIFQDPFGSLNPVHTVAHHLVRPLLLHGRATRGNVRAKALELLETVGMSPATEFIDKHPHALSGGQRQRVAVARALAAGPDLICADEPTSMLDVSIRMDVLSLLDQLRKELGVAVLFITHDLAAARHIADRILVLYGGQLMEERASDDLIAEPQHPYAQLLMAAAPRAGSSLNDALPAAPGSAPVIDPSPGCPFAARCQQALATCASEDPREHRPEPGHRLRCHLYSTGVTP
jgi:peptide/nickel transport system ATP-binding protein